MDELIWVEMLKEMADKGPLKAKRGWWDFSAWWVSIEKTDTGFTVSLTSNKNSHQPLYGTACVADYSEDGILQNAYKTNLSLWLAKDEEEISWIHRTLRTEVRWAWRKHMSKKCMVMKHGRVYVRHPKGMSDRDWLRNCRRFIKNLGLTEDGFQVEIYEGEGSSMISTPDMGFEVAYYWQYIELDNLGEIHMGSPDD